MIFLPVYLNTIASRYGILMRSRPKFEALRWNTPLPNRNLRIEKSNMLNSIHYFNVYVRD